MDVGVNLRCVVLRRCVIIVEFESGGPSMVLRGVALHARSSVLKTC